MTIEDIAAFCEFKDCRISAGNPELGFVHFDGRGVERDLYTYGRFSMFGEVARPPSTQAILDQASVFRIRSGDSTLEMDRQEFERQLDRFQKLAQG